MKHYLLNHQPQKGLQAACAQQGQAPTCNARGKGRTPASPKTLTKVILVLLTMFLLPDAAWGQDPAISVYYDDGLYFVSDLTVKYTWNNEGDGTEFVDGNRIPVQAGTLTYWAEGVEPVSITYYGLIIGETPLSNENVDENGAISEMSNVSFTAPATLNLKSATINSSTSGIIWKGNSDLTIQFSGNNKIDCTQSSGNNDNGICISGNGGSLNLTAVTDASTLTLTPHPSETGSNNKPAIAGFAKGVTFDSNWGMYYTDDYTTASQTEEYQIGGENVASTGAGKEVVIVKDFLGIAVAGVPVTSSNASNIEGSNISFGDSGSISFDSENKILTLKDATIDYSNISANPIISSIENLKVKLIGINTIKIANTSYCGFKYTGNNGTLTFVDPTSFSEIGQLTVFKESSSLSDANLCSGYTISNQFESSGDEAFTPQNSGWTKITPTTNYVKVRYVELYDLWIGGARISSNNLTGNGYQNYDPETSSINYSGATSSARIVSNLPELTIILSGENSLNVTDGTDPAISFTASEKTPTGFLKFAKDKNTTSTINRMTIDCANGAIVGFSEVTTDNPLKLSVPTTAPATWDNRTTKVVISDEVVYDLWVMGQQVTSANASDIFGAAQSSQTVPAIFDAEESTLTLNGLQLSNSTTYPTCIESGLESLTVTLSGDNKFQKGGDVTTLYGFKAQDGKTCNITFEASGSFSFMVQTEPEYAVSGFNKVTYKDNLVAYKKDGKTYISTLRLQFGADNTDNPTAITISPEQEGVELFSHKIAYEINYAKDGMDNIAQTEYTAAIPIATISAGPCIVSAYTIDGDNTKSNATKSYYFIYSESELIIGTESTLDLRNYLLPSIAEEDNWSCEHMTDNTDIISIDSQNGIITGLADGTATVSTQIIDGNEEYSVLNYYISQLSIDVTVQDIIGESTFASGQSYGTFYNTDQTYAYNVPEGLEAYIIKSVDEEKGEIVTEGTSVLPPSTPVLLYRTSTSGSANYVFTKVSGVEPANTELKYTATEKEADESSKLYVLYNGQFVRVTANTTILANHCYLDLSGTTAGTRGFYNIGDGEGTTSLREVKSEGVKGEKWNDGEWYTLQGRKFTTKPTKPGLYILNGKKVVIK